MQDNYDLNKIRNFSIISHVDHGKSTLCDRILELTHAVDPRLMREQFLDSMDLERERGITIKAQSVRVNYKDFVFNLIDTPGHVDFNYEVSRSLTACEGVILLVDASQGIQAQTLANCYLAIEHDLEIVAALNKIDLPQGYPEAVAEEIEKVLGLKKESILRISAKTGQGVKELLDQVITRIPPPKGDLQKPLRALIFDSYYDHYRGVISSIRIFDGLVQTGQSITLMQANTTYIVEELGVITPERKNVQTLKAGEVGYMIAGIKNVSQARPGETITDSKNPTKIAISGYKIPKPMVFCGLYPIESDNFDDLKEALEKLKLNDGAFTYEPENSAALGYGFRCGFLGLLHMDIVKERLEREFNLSLIATAPSVEYEVILTDNTSITVKNPTDMPDPSKIKVIKEPMLIITIITPTAYTGAIIELCNQKRGQMLKMNYLSSERVELSYKMPLSEMILDFFDAVKSKTKGYASIDYEPAGYQEEKLVKLDILVNGTAVDAFSIIAPKDKAESYGRNCVKKLRELIPRQLFDVPIQAAIGSKIVARETVKAKRKDVIAKCYGGDVTRKKKLLQKQKEGKKKMKSIGKVEVPQEVFISALKIDSSFN
jgi:GTP-binding protein LepA